MNDEVRDKATRLCEILSRQRTEFLRAGAPSIAERRRDLQTLRSAILARRGDIEAALNADFGHRSRHETALFEIVTLIQGISYLHRNLRAFMRPTPRAVAWHSQLGRAHIEYQPLGVVGVMAPWNYPFSLALMPLATSIAAGNRTMLKPSEFAPATGELMLKMLTELFSDEQIAVVTGDASVGAAFSELPFDHLIFTGSTAVGRSIMKAASHNLTPLTLELGGKSPVLIEKGYARDSVAASVAFGKLANAGQTCIAPDYALVHESDLETFIGSYDRAVVSLYPNGPTTDDYTSIINEHHYLRVLALIDDARANGARVLTVGRNPGDADRRPHTIAPMIVRDVQDTMRVMKEEIFGPVLPIVAYRDIDEAISYVNARPRPLALYLYARNGEQRRRVLSRTTSGNVTINGTLMHYAQEALPFGGVGASGMGAYHGVEGFRRLSHAKGIFEQRRWNSATLLSAPFGSVTEAILKFLLR